MKRLVLWLLLAFALGTGAVLAQQGATVNPIPGSVWTYLGATYGADWVMPPQLSSPWVPHNGALAGTVPATPQIYRAGYAAPGDGGQMLYTHSGAACSFNGGVGDNGSQVKAMDGGCWLAAPPVTGWDAAVFGASAAAADNTAAINAAINAGCHTSGASGGSIAVTISGMYKVTGTIGPLNCSGVALLGINPYVGGIICTGTGTADCIQLGAFTASPATNCTGASPPSTCLTPTGNRIANLAIDAHTRTGGYAISMNGAALPRLDNLIISGWKILYETYVAHAYANNIMAFMYSTNPTDYGVVLYNLITSGSSSWYKVDVADFNNVVIRSQTQGGANCMLIDGAIETVTIKGMALLACRNGLDISNTQHQTVEGYFPTFIVARDLEIDGATNNAMNINAGKNMMFTQGNWNANAAPLTCRNCNILNIQSDTGYSSTSTIWISDTDIHNGPAAGVYLQALDVSFNNVKIHDLCWYGNTACFSAGGDSAIQIFNGSTAIKITNSVLSPIAGDFHANDMINGVYINAGASNIIIGNNDFHSIAPSSSMVANIINGTTNPVSFVGGTGYNGAPIAGPTCAAGATC